MGRPSLDKPCVGAVVRRRIVPALRLIATSSLVAGTLMVGLSGTASAAPSVRAASGTLTYAEGPGANPNYIFPFMGCAYFGVNNINQFQELMYRPLYWFGLGGSVSVQYPLSLAQAPVESSNHETVTINLKGWQFSDSQPVDAESVAFFLNVYKADPSNYCGYNAGFAIPDELNDVTYPGGLAGQQVVLHFSSPVNASWLLYNYLSEITPFPETWDKTSTGGATGSGGCGTATYGSPGAATACGRTGVEGFLDAQSADTTTYTDAMWQTVDGPYSLSAFDTVGDATFVPNAAYSGPQHSLLATVKEKAYTTTTAEENDLYAHAIQLGYVDPNILPSVAPAPGDVGSNVHALNSTYKLVTGTPWSFNYAPWNFSSTDVKIAAVRQLYIRQAMQLALNQLGIIRSVDKGYGWPTYSPLPPKTPSSLSDPVKNLYPFNVARASALLARHGWRIKHGVRTCERPGTSPTACGAGIAKGYELNFRMVIPSGVPAYTSTANTEVSAWNRVGISVYLSTCGFSGGCPPADNDCEGDAIQLCWWGGGWIYAPDYYPSGEALLDPSGGFDVGGYSDAHMDALITSTTTGSASLTAYARYAAQQLPVLYEPNPTATGEQARSIKCVTAADCVPNPLQNFMPEYFDY
jgi:peptide/nickel transport system substrate-binding protein